MAAISESHQDVDAIIKACTYHRSEWDKVLIRTPKTKLKAPFLQTTFKTTASSGLGFLDRLPQELTLMILGELDILTYLRFRRVNRHARSIATASREYMVVVKHGLEGLKPLLKAQLGHLFTFSHFYGNLVSKECKFCRKFGPFLFLPTCQRCCFTCLQVSSELKLLAIPVPKTFARAVGRSAEEIERACEPKLRVVYGKYTNEEWPLPKRPKYLIQANRAVEKLQSLDSSIRIPETVLEHQPEHQFHNDGQHLFCFRYMAATTFPWYDLNHDKPERGVNCKGCQFRVEEYLLETRASPPWGHNDRDRNYTSEEFLDHFRSCKHAKKVWANAQENHVAQESHFTRNGGIVLEHRRHELH
ncbi:hypothetical protein F53441_13471 [Fusarium austroafricanum]|uniref:F-box domain-containing protein n=1 Tax=Fusarium austroafricanum TaxID=2364996 RepID=A0A8H4JP24_9HYPO|nr:hypothetical protein F53441_13471 [Fusarium austroafricanum]